MSDEKGVVVRVSSATRDRAHDERILLTGGKWKLAS